LFLIPFVRGGVVNFSAVWYCKAIKTIWDCGANEKRQEIQDFV
jgi:hypothetical protein